MIERIHAREVLDSRGNPTVQADVYTRQGFGRFSVPSGASKGRFEAHELRDTGDKRFGGLGVRTAVGNVTKIIGPSVIGLDARNQSGIDRTMLSLDGTERKDRLGANALLAVSMAVAKAAADTNKKPFYNYLLTSGRTPLLPMPMMNILNGGKHAGNDISFQEFMILPSGFKNFGEALQAGSEIYHTLGKMLAKKYGKSAVNVGDEGGYAPSLKTIRIAMDAVDAAVRESGYVSRKEVLLGIDAASGSFYEEKSRAYLVDGRKINAEKLFELYEDLVESYGLRSIEDPFQDDDFESFARITEKLAGKVQIVGDDLFVTNARRLGKGIEIGAANALLVKVNQAGTLTETLEAIDMARKANYGLVMSHRSGETEDSSIADLAVGLATGQIKTGAPARGERTAKYNRLIQIEEELREKATYYGPKFLHS
ncbi:MAG TPA: phosphopyruvate hydratase [Dongiaceae bacterium]|nr:phosphopyruvate hydratase [Dongiaceae bacterium]